MSHLPVIFLDFDGVLNHTLHAIATLNQPRATNRLDFGSIKLLNELIGETGAKVVVSSTWRKGRTIEELQTILNEYGFAGEVIGKTPSFNDNCSLRGNEILSWIQENNEMLTGDKHNYHEYKRYVILDDDSDMLYWQKDNFICIDRYCGITRKTIFMAEKLLSDKSKIYE